MGWRLWSLASIIWLDFHSHSWGNTYNDLSLSQPIEMLKGGEEAVHVYSAKLLSSLTCQSQSDPGALKVRSHSHYLGHLYLISIEALGLGCPARAGFGAQNKVVSVLLAPECLPLLYSSNRMEACSPTWPLPPYEGIVRYRPNSCTLRPLPAFFSTLLARINSPIVSFHLKFPCQALENE